MSTDELTKPVEVPGAVWLAVKWGCGLLSAGAVGLLGYLVGFAIDMNGRVATLERDSNTLMEIKQNTEALRSGMEEVKRDVAVLKARTP